MAAKRKIEKTIGAARAAPIALADSADHDAAPSPAHHLQAHLVETLSEAPRWSPRKTALVAVVACGGAWAGIAWAVSRLLH